MVNSEQNNNVNDIKEVFISYHTKSAGEAVRKICAALEGAGISCWYAPRNVGANYAQSIVEAIRSCRVFLLVLNKESNLSAHVLNEINCAFDRFRNHENIILLPFRIDDCVLSDDVYYYLGRIHIMDGSLPPEVLRIRELVDRVSSILGKGIERTVTLTSDDIGTILSAESSSASSEQTYRLTNSMVYPDSHFVGRTKELTEIHRYLSSAENKMFLVGMGGIGKSEIARMYIKRHQTDYDVILWVSFEGSIEQTLINDYAFPIQGLSRTKFPEDSDQEYFQRKLRILKEISDRRILIVLDNFDVTDDPQLEAFCSGTYTVIFTTRYHQENQHLPEVYLSEMTDEADLLELFKTEYSRSLDETALAYVKDIIRQLNGHTLSIRLVASTMQHRRIAPEKMSALLKSGAATMSKENTRAADMIFGQLKEVFRLSTLSEDEQYLLKNLALVPLRGISVETLYDWCGLEDFDVIDDLIKKSWIIHNPATDEVHLHPLVADLFQEKLADDSKSCNSFLNALQKSVEHSQTKNMSYEHKQQLQDIANSAFEILPSSHPLRWNTLKAKAEINLSMSLYHKCANMWQELLETTQDMTEKLYVYNKLAHIEALSGNAEECRKIAQEGYSIVKDTILDKLSIEQGHLYIELLCRLIESNRDLGDYDTAIHYGREAVSIGGRFYAYGMKKQERQGWLDYHLGRVLYMNGDFDESEMLMLHAIELFLEVNDQWATSFCYDVLGQIHMKRSEFDIALDFNRKAYDILLPRLGGNQVDIAINLEWRGNIFHTMGEEEKAVDCYLQAAGIYHKLNLTKKEDKVLAILRDRTASRHVCDV